MERSMLEIKLKDKRTNEYIRRKSGVTNVAERVVILKWKWTGHIIRRDDER